jgi:hypothetical protein
MLGLQGSAGGHLCWRLPPIEGGHIMNLSGKVKSFLDSPKGRQMMDRGRQEMSKPENQRKIRNLMNKVKKGR